METTGKKRQIPWWTSIVAAVVVYCTLKYVVPVLNPENETLRSFLQLGPVAAPIFTIALLLLGAKQLYDIEPEKDSEDDSDAPPERSGDNGTSPH